MKPWLVACSTTDRLSGSATFSMRGNFTPWRREYRGLAVGARHRDLHCGGLPGQSCVEVVTNLLRTDGLIQAVSGSADNASTRAWAAWAAPEKREGDQNQGC